MEKPLPLAILGVIFFFGMAGFAWKWYVAAWLLTSESIDSPKWMRRWINRYLIFSFYYLISFMASSPFVVLVVRAMKAAGIGQSWIGIVDLLLCLPLAWLLTKFDFWWARRFDERKRKGRERLAVRRRGKP